MDEKNKALILVSCQDHVSQALLYSILLYSSTCIGPINTALRAPDFCSHIEQFIGLTLILIDGLAS